MSEIERMRGGLTFKAFHDIRTAPDLMRTVFKDIEGREFDYSLDLPESLRGTCKSIAEFTFLSRYIIAVVKNLVNSPKDQDIILEAYGFLEGYENLNLKRRHELYCKHIGINKDGTDIPLYKYWPEDDIDRSMRSKEDAAIRKLANALNAERVNQSTNASNAKQMNQSTNASNAKQMNQSTNLYIDMAKKLCTKPFPTPNYLLGDGYRKCEIDGHVFYIPLSNEELRSLSNKRTTGDEININPDDNQDLNPNEIDINPDDELDNPDNDLKDKIIIDNNISWLKNGALHNVWNKPWKMFLMFLMFLIVLTIIIPIAYKDKNIDKKEDEEFREMIPESVLNGIQDTNIDSGEWEYTEEISGKSIKTKVSVIHEEVTEEFEPDE